MVLIIQALLAGQFNQLFTKTKTMGTVNFKNHFDRIHEIEFMFVFKGFTVMMLHDGRQDVIDLPLVEIEKQLEDDRFFRIHKSYIVNLKRIRELEVSDNRMSIRMNGKLLPVSRRRKRALLKVLTK